MIQSLTIPQNDTEDLGIEDLQGKITQRVVLPNVSWQTYQVLLVDLGDRRSTRLAYDRGVLEIIMPSDIHEINKHLLERIIIALTEEFDMPIRGVGSVTLNREDLQRGAEPDAGFYIQNAAKIRGTKIDLEIDPPPDLIIEVDINSSSSRRFQIYQDLGVSEIWRCTKKTFKIYQLEAEKYVSCDRSPTFPDVPATLIKQWLDLAEIELDDNAMVRSLRQWVRDLKNEKK
ncbi:Uma2 family endonuclease [Spirulina sp. 06S082]|uniref:Uma2 family endonuclease n=1 Tax=Spirulina sp. 06S082 TaxID=3110248 RepID=UPI002B1EE48F|nr:Uma2 family endonuclease [Spirulina sp. 06S082]MEA5468092.1 Uma2 family endonuclease [Spirulina sp. 06S082]